MKNLFLIILFFMTACSNTKLICSKTNYSIIYGKEVQKETYEFENNKLVNYTNSKKILFDDNMMKYIEDLFEYYKIESNIIEECIKGSNVYVEKNSNYIITKIFLNINSSDSTIKKLNIEKNVSIEYLKKNLTEKGFSCEFGKE